MAQQCLDVHPFRPGVEQVRGVGVAQLMRRNLFLDSGLLHHPPQIGAGRLGGRRRLAGGPREHELAPGLVPEPEPEHLAERFRQRRPPFLVVLADHSHRPGRPVHQSHVRHLEPQRLASGRGLPPASGKCRLNLREFSY